MEKDNKTKKVTVIIISILIVIILVLGLTYAYLRTELSGSEQLVKVGTLDLILNETSEGITLDNAIGLSDSQGMSTTPSTFELKNNGDKAVDYIIYLDDNTIGESDTRIDDKYLKYNLNKNGDDSGASLLTSIGSNPNRILDMGTIEGGETNTYSLNLWITDEVDGNYGGQVFSGKLRVEVSQERKTVAEVLLADSANNINTSDPEQTFITGENPNNYIWYSGKLWRAVSIDPSDNSVKLVTDRAVTTVSYDDSSNSYEDSNIKEWLNDTSVDGFLGNLREPEKFMKMDSKWNATAMTDTSKPPKTTIVTSPVGMLNSYEYESSLGGNSYNNGYLNIRLDTWILNPYDNNRSIAVTSSGEFNTDVGYLNSYGIRPTINLQSSIKIVDGSGTEDDPYRLMGDNDNNLSETYLKDRYSGEYIRFGTGENNLYRIVSHETEGLTKIASAQPLKDNGVLKEISFGDYIYSPNSGIGEFLNDEYLKQYLTTEDVNMVEKDTIWYLGNMTKASDNYKLSKYKDENGNNLSDNTSVATVGLLRFSELMSTQSENARYNKTLSTLTIIEHLSLFIGISQYGGGAYNTDNTMIFAIRPALNLKSNVIITSGDGTKENPFELSVQ